MKASVCQREREGKRLLYFLLVKAVLVLEVYMPRPSQVCPVIRFSWWFRECSRQEGSVHWRQFIVEADITGHWGILLRDTTVRSSQTILCFLEASHSTGNLQACSQSQTATPHLKYKHMHSGHHFHHRDGLHFRNILSLNKPPLENKLRSLTTKPHDSNMLGLKSQLVSL